MTSRPTVLAPLVLGLAVGLLGCARSHSPNGPIADLCPEFVPATGFSSREVYVEFDSPGCASERPTCMVWRLEGSPRSDCSTSCADEDEIAQRVFCSCRCDQPGCDCQDGEVCLTTGGGSYCVPTGLAAEW